MKKVLTKLLNLFFKSKSTIKINGIQYSGKSIQLIQDGDKLTVVVDGQELSSELSKEIKITIDSSSDIDKIESYSDLSVNCNNIGGDVHTMSGDVRCSGNINGSVKTMSGDVEAHFIAGKVETMSGDINKL